MFRYSTTHRRRSSRSITEHFHVVGRGVERPGVVQGDVEVEDYVQLLVLPQSQRHRSDPLLGRSVGIVDRSVVITDTGEQTKKCLTCLFVQIYGHIQT